MDQTVTFGEKQQPSWQAVHDLLMRGGFTLQLRMIDGQLAFPDESPPDDWKEIRVAVPQGMVTVQRSAGRLTLVTWGNADSGLQQAWNALTWAFAEAGGGTIHTAQGSIGAATFRRTAELPEALRASG